ncbi:MAG: L,D-transpeptidase family protein [Bacteroidales bacterium]|nr:L,D-transpeptidase family protein [Bacteroidales bacterium]MCF8457390.1 L,D-transpeptidase family protein [Bacteroidales bacterium]
MTKKKFLKLALGLIILSLILVAYIAISWQQPPILEIKEARENLVEAERLNSSLYASRLLAKAKQYYDSAMSSWQTENEKLFITRDYSLAKRYADEASKTALASIEEARTASGNIKDLLTGQIKKVQDQIARYMTIYRTVPLNEEHRKKLIDANLLTEEANMAFRKEDFQHAAKKIDSAELCINQTTAYSKKILTNYFSEFPNWEDWAEKAIHNSKKNKTTCILVDKQARKCLLYKNGELQDIFNIELGPNWIGDKNYQGDKSTPEGTYKIVAKKSSNSTRYHKAFLLNYPNEEDHKRFLFNKKNGGLKKNAKIGNLIEIHGHGGKGTDWTDGCIALENEDMDKLFQACKEGTEVTIIGSLKSLKDIINPSNE